MFNWFTLSDAALIRAANHIAAADTALEQNAAVSYHIHTLNAQRYQLISRYCMIRARRMFFL